MLAIGHLPDTDLGPVISPQSKKRILQLVQSGIDQGAQCILDGRDITVPGYENGNFVGPTILTGVTVRGQSCSFFCASDPLCDPTTTGKHPSIGL